MKKSVVLLSILFLLTISVRNLFAQRTCAAHDHMLEQISDNPEMYDNMEALEEYTQEFVANWDENSKATRIIPIYVHVIYNTTQQNISDAQIQSQIDVLNADYGGTNFDLPNTPAEFAKANGTGIQFVLAGIDRKQSTKTEWGTADAMKKSSQGGVDPITPSTHLNMWICNIGGGILGYAQFPGGSSTTDGVVFSPQYCGTIVNPTTGGTYTGSSSFYLESPFNKGRTATHEIGHYLNLRHIWGDGNCSATDYVDDTPIAAAANYGCPTYPKKSCTGNTTWTSDMFMNYMDYTDDGCMFMFSAGQSARMWACLTSSRSTLGTSGTVTPTAPTATTSAATLISTNTTTINGTVNANNATTTVTFEYGTTTSYGSTATATPSSLTGATATSVSANLTGLTANTTYNYRVKAVNSVGTTYGSNMTFTTSPNPVAVTLPFTENFASTIPTGWSQVNTGTGVTDRWTTSNTANAGGTAYEMKMSYQQVNPATARLVTPAINTVGVTSATLTFKHMLDAYATGVNIKVQTSTNKTTWTDAYSVACTATNIAAATVTVNLTTNLNSATTYVAFVVDGDLYQVDYYYIDNVSIVAGGGSTVVIPTISTTAASSIAQTTAVTGGNITSNGGGTITAAGVCYATTTNPTTSNSAVTTTTTSGAFTSNLTGLTANTTYYARAYATNSAGTAYGAQITFTTLPTSGGTTSDVTVGTGTSTQGYPLSPYYGYERSASLYTSAEIAKFGSISKLGWYPTVTTTVNVPVKIYIKTTTATTLTASTWATAISGATLVYSGTMAGTTANAWKEFTLSTPYNYTSGNLMVLVETNYGGAGTGASTGSSIRYTSKTSCHMYVRADNTAPTGTMTRNSYRPNIKITITTSSARTSSEIETASVNVYPNPATDLINVQLAENQEYSIEIYNIAGVKVMNSIINENNTEINISELSVGTYIIKMTDGVNIFTDKFIKY